MTDTPAQSNGRREQSPPAFAKREYTLAEVDPRELTYLAPDREDDVLRPESPVVQSLDRVGIIMPIVIDADNCVYPGRGRIRTLWAIDRGLPTIPVLRIGSGGADPEEVYVALATEDLKQTTSQERALVYLEHFLPRIRAIHNDEKERRRLEKNAKISDTLRKQRAATGRDTGDSLAHHKNDFDAGDSWDQREFGTPSQRRRHDRNNRFRIEATIAQFFGDVRGESYWRKVLEIYQAERQPDIPLLNLNVRSRRERIGRGEYSLDGECRRIRDAQRAAQLKRALCERLSYDEEAAQLAVTWLFERIRRDNVWSWDRANLCFGLFRQQKLFKESVRSQYSGDPDEFEEYFNGAYPGADIPLNIMAYCTNPGDPVIDFFAGSGATKDAARHFLDPFWPSESGDYVYWRHWRDTFYDLLDHKSGKPNLDEIVFPPDYFERDGHRVDHSRPCLQYDLHPNPLALRHFGDGFILHHDVRQGVTAKVEDDIRAVRPDGASVIYLDPPYGSQNLYAAGQSDLSAACFSELIEVLSEFITDCRRLLAPSGRLMLRMATDWRQSNYFDPGQAIVEQVGQWYEYDWAGPLGPRIEVPTKGYGMRRARARKARLRQLANRHRYLHVLVPKARPRRTEEGHGKKCGENPVTTKDSAQETCI